MIESLERRIQLTAGLPDPSFATDGVARSNFGDSDAAQDAVMDSNGRIVVCGFTFKGDLLKGEQTTEPLIARYLPSGNPDTTFGDGGAVVSQFGLKNAYAVRVIALPDGRVLCLSQTGNAGNDAGMLVCLHGDGSLDKKFGDGGEVATVASDFTVAPDGSIILLTRDDLRRLHSNGLPDHSYAGQGKLIINDPKIDYVEFDSITTFKNSIYVASGSDLPNAIEPGVGVVRLDSHGNLDKTYGIDGVAISGQISDAGEAKIAMQSDGSAIVASEDGTVRFTADGEFDPSFGEGGSIDGSSEIVQTDSMGRIIEYGDDIEPTGAINRYSPEGKVDRTFSVDGAADMLQPLGTQVDPTSFVIDQSGEIIVVGGLNDDHTGLSDIDINRLFSGEGSTLVTFKGGTLRFNDYETSDSIGVSYNGSSIAFSLDTDNVVASVPAAKVRRIIVNGNGGDDRIISTLGDAPKLNEVIFDGDDGNDSLDGNSGDVGKYIEMFYGGAGKDVLMAQSPHALLDGGEGNDSIDDSKGGFSTLTGDAGNDTLNGENQHPDTIDGGAGNDTAYYDSTDKLQSVEVKSQTLPY